MEISFIIIFYILGCIMSHTRLTSIENEFTFEEYKWLRETSEFKREITVLLSWLGYLICSVSANWAGIRTKKHISFNRKNKI